MRRPGEADLAQFAGLWLRIERFEHTIAFPNAEVVGGQNIATLERVHQQHLHGPMSDALDRGEPGDRSLIAHHGRHLPHLLDLPRPSRGAARDRARRNQAPDFIISHRAIQLPREREQFWLEWFGECRARLERGADRLPVMDRAMAFGLGEVDRCPFLARIAGVIDRARGRAQPHVVLHFPSPSISNRRHFRRAMRIRT